MKLKILHLTQFLGVGGLEKVLFLLIKEQMKAGHQVELMVYDYEQTWVPYFREHGINIITTYRKAEGYDLKLLREILRRSKDVDVIHTHDLNPLMYAAPMRFWQRLFLKRSPRLVHTAHGMDHLHKRPITRIYERLCSLLTSYTVGVSAPVCEYYKKLGVPESRLININNGTAIPQDSADPIRNRNTIRASFKIPLDAVVWVSIARVVPLKDQKLLCELARRNPEHHFLLIGPSGDESYWKELMSIKPNNVHMPGGRADIEDILRSADYFISASHHEGIPISVLEAGAVGLPCLLSDIDGHKVLQEGFIRPVAHYFKTGDILDLQTKAKELEDKPEFTAIIRQALHHQVLENFSAESMYRKYLKTYQGTIHEN